MNQALTVVNDMDVMSLGSVLSKSGYFQDAREASQAVVKVLAGREMGFGPIASMTGINIIKGRVSLGANLIAAAIKRSGRYDYRVKVMTDVECTVEFYERVDGKREIIGVSTFTIADARKAGTQNIDKFPRNMLFARTVSNGAKWFCADVFGGPVYTPDELGAIVNGDTLEVSSIPAGDVVDASTGELVTPEPAKPAAPKPQPPAAPKSNGNGKGPTLQQVAAKWDQLVSWAQALGVEADLSIEHDATIEQYIARGKALKPKVLEIAKPMSDLPPSAIEDEHIKRAVALMAQYETEPVTNG